MGRVRNSSSVNASTAITQGGSVTQEELQARVRRILGRSLRRIFKYSGIPTLAKKVQPTCSVCDETEDLEVDHEPPVSPVDRDIKDPMEYFKRMFCMDDSGIIHLSRLNVLCSEHHAEKTTRERELRLKYKTGPYSKESRIKASVTRLRKRRRKK